jgi:hypothetical protein
MPKSKILLTRLADYIAKEPERKRLQDEKIEKKIKKGLMEIPKKKVEIDKEFEEKHEKVLDEIDDAISTGKF